ncbi:hypothetical protein MMC25_008216 [Agyrium rufum]|nr:hypothetical protein [Agyrium rufum]
MPAPLTSDIPPQPLSLPAATFAKLSPGPYLLAHLQPPPASKRPSLRLNRRAPHQHRPLTKNCGSLTNTHGSAVVRVGDTAVVCGVRAEILSAGNVGGYNYWGEKGVEAEELTGGSGRRQRKRSKSDRDGGDAMEVDSNGKRGASRSAQDLTEEQEHAQRKRDKEDLLNLGLLVPNLELATGCNATHLPGNPPSALAQSLSQRILQLLHTTDVVQMPDLRIWDKGGRGGGSTSSDSLDTSSSSSNESEDADADNDEKERSNNQLPRVKAFWTLYIDILYISLDGGALDAAWMAIMAALKDTRLPEVRWDQDLQVVVCGTEDGDSGGYLDGETSLAIRGCPVVCTFSVFEHRGGIGVPQAEGEDEVIDDDDNNDNGDINGKGRRKASRWFLADPDAFEEGICEGSITIVVDGEGAHGGGKLYGMDMTGCEIQMGDLGAIKEVMRMAQDWGQEWSKVINS